MFERLNRRGGGEADRRASQQAWRQATRRMATTAERVGAQWREARERVPALASWGPASARHLRLLLVGVEGHHALAGSRVAHALLRAESFGEARRTVVIHGVDAWACERGRPITRDGIALDRNFVDFAAPLPDDDDYAELHAPLVYTHLDSPARRQADAALADKAVALAAAGLTPWDVVERGQHRFADGLGFGGRRPAAAREVLEPFFVELLSELRQVRTDALEILTVHSGGARWGRIDRIPGASRGSLARWLSQRASASAIETATLRVGTFGHAAALDRLRDDAIVRLGSDRHRHPETASMPAARLRGHFCPADAAWQARVDASAAALA